MRLLLAGALLVGLSLPAAAERFGIVPPLGGNPFFEAMRQGCTARAQALGNVQCAWAPAGGEETRSQAQIIRDLVSEKVDGIALSPGADDEVKKAIDAAVDAGIPVVTFDADRPDSSRNAFIGTNARDFGRQLGSSLKRWKPKGGRYAIVTMDPTMPILAERISGVRDALAVGWSEIEGGPRVISGDFVEAVDIIDRLLEKPGDVDAIISVGAWPMLAEDEWRAMIAKVKPRIDRAEVVLVVADALPLQKSLVREGLGHVLVGQRPEDMGARVIDVLTDLARGRRAAEIVYVGFDTITRLDLIKAGKEAR